MLSEYELLCGCKGEKCPKISILGHYSFLFLIEVFHYLGWLDMVYILHNQKIRQYYFYP